MNKSKKRTKERWLAVGAFVASTTLSGRAAGPVLASDRTPLGQSSLTRDLLTRRFDLGSINTALTAAPDHVSDPQQSRSVRFDIPPGTLDTVIAAFETATGIKVSTAVDSILTIHSPGVSGLHSGEQALRQLLDGTGVTYRFTAPNAVTLDVAAVEEFVQVSAQAVPLSLRTFTEPVRDIPQTIEVIPSAVIQAQGVTSLRDVLRNVPGITFQAGEGGGGLPGDNLSIRGFSAGNDIFVDGVRDPGGYSRDVFNLEQVEVTKGPSSATVGRGATGGAINQVTKSPLMRPAYSGTVGGGNADYGRATVDLNVPAERLWKGAALRLNAMWTDSSVPGRDVVENSGWGIAPALGFGLGAPTSVTLKYQHLNQNNVPDYGLPWGASPGFPTGAFEATPPIDQSNFYGLRDYDFEDIESDIGTAEVQHRFAGPFTLRNLTRYSETSRDSAITSPRPPNRQLQRRTMNNENLANQTNVIGAFSTGRVGHDVVAGFEIARETTHNRNSSQTTNQPQTNIVNPNPDDRPLGPMPPNTGNPSETQLNLVGIYAFDTVKLGNRWQLTGGARFDVVDVDYSLTNLIDGTVTALDSADRMLSWRAGVVYKPRPNGSLYLGYGTSFNPSVDAAATGAALSGAATAANNPALEPEETRNYEAGAKWDTAGGRLSLNGALFRTEKFNARSRNAANDPFVLSGKQSVAGVELGISGQILEGWTAFGSYAFMKSEITASENQAEVGNNLILTPESTFNIWTTYALPWDVTVGGGAQYMDAVFRNTVNTITVPSYWLVNATASYGVNQHLTLRLNLQNMTDEQYVDRVGGGHYIPGPRRQLILSTDWRF
jgi:catecholate siderophore receptor